MSPTLRMRHSRTGVAGLISRNSGIRIWPSHCIHRDVFPSVVRDFIEAYIDSVETLQVLLFLRTEAEKEWHGADVSRATGQVESATLQSLEALRSFGLIGAEHLGS